MKIRFSIPKFIKDALYNNHKFSIIPAARRSGKTYNAAQWQLEKLLTEKAGGLWVDTTQNNLDKYVERYHKTFLEPIWHLCSYSKLDKTLKLPSGSYIDFRSAERPENIEGFQYKYNVLNEAGIILKKQGLWHDTLMPMFKGDSFVRVVGSTKGKGTFEQLFTRGQDPEEKNYYSQKITAYDSPFWDKEEIEEIKKHTPTDLFNQVYMAEFIEGAGAVFRNIKLCINNQAFDKPTSGKSYTMAIDLAKHQDFTVITVADRQSKHIGYIDRFNQLDWGFQKKRIIETWRRFNRPETIIDSSGVGDAIYDDLKSAGMNISGFKFTSSSKNELIKNLSVSMDNKEITFVPDQVLINELEIFEYEVSRLGNVRYNAPEGFHDDAVISLALNNHLLSSSIEPFFFSF